MFWSSILAERDVALAAAVSARLGLPAHVDNEANLCAMAELWFGAGRGRSDFAVITIEHGLGMGLAISRTIVENHGGRLWLDASVESGARFGFNIPSI